MTLDLFNDYICLTSLQVYLNSHHVPTNAEDEGDFVSKMRYITQPERYGEHDEKYHQVNRQGGGYSAAVEAVEGVPDLDTPGYRHHGEQEQAEPDLREIRVD